MEKLGFTRDDLAVFSVDAAHVRERIFQERLQPKLESIAYRFAPPLSRIAGAPLSAVVHLPHTGGNRSEATATFIKAGGDSLTDPYFSFVITRGGVHARLIIARQIAGRDQFAQRLSKAATALAKDFGDVELRCYDDWDGRGIPALTAAKAPFWREVAGRLAKAAGYLDIGVGWPEARAVLLAYEDLLPAFRTLVPLYRRLHASA